MNDLRLAKCIKFVVAMLETVIQLDIALLEWIHRSLHSDFLNAVIPYFRSKYFWIPVYVFFIAFALINYKWRGMIWLLFVFAMIGISDSLSSKGIKRTVKRTRPCHTAVVKENIDLLVPCGGLYSFTSSHATNHFALSVFMFLTLGRAIPGIRWPVIAWAALVSFAQVYVGVHYPLDVLGGALVGLLLGWAMGSIFNRRWGFLMPSLETSFQQHKSIDHGKN